MREHTIVLSSWSREQLRFFTHLFFYFLFSFYIIISGDVGVADFYFVKTKLCLISTMRLPIAYHWFSSMVRLTCLLDMYIPKICNAMYFLRVQLLFFIFCCCQSATNAKHQVVTGAKIVIVAPSLFKSNVLNFCFHIHT
jgi:hypothetical protein